MIPKPELPPLPRSVAEATAECRTLYERYWPELRPRLLAALPPPDGSPVTVAADPQVILLTAAGVSNEGPSFLGLAPRAGSFLALGFGLGLVGTVSARR